MTAAVLNWQAAGGYELPLPKTGECDENGIRVPFVCFAFVCFGDFRTPGAATFLKKHDKFFKLESCRRGHGAHRSRPTRWHAQILNAAIGSKSELRRRWYKAGSRIGIMGGVPKDGKSNRGYGRSRINGRRGRPRHAEVGRFRNRDYGIA